MDLKPHNKMNQDFLWIANYADGENLLEYDTNTRKENSFYSIDRSRLIRFGLFGHGMHLYHDILGGSFKVKGQKFDFVYKVGNKEYNLTGQDSLYNDIITYKDAESIARVTRDPSGRFINRITAFNTGYKKQLNIEGVTFNLKVILCLPFDNPAYFLVRLVADKNMDGKLIMKKDGRELSTFDAPLRQGVGGEMKFLIK